MLKVWTARLSTRDPDAVNTTRKSGNTAFAPSWKLVGPLVEIKKAGRPVTDDEWKTYAAGYLAEMTESYRRNRATWDSLLARERVVLTCYCPDPNRCHRRILAKILAHLGAVDCGELV
jgi:uncharacterized protein YeaO (DUF488 family)